MNGPVTIIIQRVCNKDAQLAVVVDDIIQWIRSLKNYYKKMFLMLEEPVDLTVNRNADVTSKWDCRLSNYRLSVPLRELRSPPMYSPKIPRSQGYDD